MIWLEPASVPRLGEIGIDGPVLLFAAAVSLLAGLAFGWMPALRQSLLAARHEIASGLREGGRSNSAGRERQRMRSGLVVAQVALGLVLLIGSGLLLRSFDALRNVAPGYTAPEEVTLFRLSVPHAEVSDELEAARLLESIALGVEQIPGVESVGISSSVTMGGNSSTDALNVEGFLVEEGSMPPVRRYKFIGEGYHATMGNPLLVGRALTWDDSREQRMVAMVTEDFAREYWGSPEAALGKRISDGIPGQDTYYWREIVGVVGNVHDDGPSQATVPIIFFPYVMSNFWGSDPFVMRSVSYVVRSERTGMPDFISELQKTVWQTSPNLPLANFGTLAEIDRRSTARASFAMLMLSLASLVALVIGAVGIYGVISYIVSQRTKEFGVRLALGAERSQVRAIVVRYGMLLVSAGLLVGLGVAALASELIARLLFGVAPRDPLSFAAGVAVLLLVALVSSLLAARRAASVDPVVALRSD